MSALETTALGAALRDNLTALAQGRELVAAMSPERYGRRQRACFDSSAGGHLRHVLEHYASFLEALGSGRLDYEARARDPRIEREPAHAVAIIDDLAAGLRRAAVGAEGRALRVRSECAGAGQAEGFGVASPAAAGEAWAESSALRELEFLLSHTIHHYALIATICALDGWPVPADFGMAPSTLRHRRAEARRALAEAGAAA